MESVEQRSDGTFCAVWSWSALFTKKPLVSSTVREKNNFNNMALTSYFIFSYVYMIHLGLQRHDKKKNAKMKKPEFMFTIAALWVTQLWNQSVESADLAFVQEANVRNW